MRFSRGDLEAVVKLLGEACELEGTEAFPVPFLERLGGAFHAEAVTYAYADPRSRTYLDGVGVADFDEDPELNAHYWELNHECPLFVHRQTTSSAAVRMSDLISRRRLQRLRLYNEYFRPYTLEHFVQVGLPAPPLRDRYIMLFRHPGTADFSERDRDLLELLRPHLVRMHELAELRAHVASEQQDISMLTPREQEVVDLVAEGKTNAQIAAELWVAPSTVKKHLENVYEKLGVRSRTAAVTRTRAG